LNVVQQIHPSQLATAVNQQTVVLVDFFTPTCGPCRQMPPLMQQVNQMTGVPVYKVDITQDGMQQANTLGIRSVPTIIAFKNGREVNRLVGVPSVQQLAALAQS
jgi:thioredoxin 1